MTLDLDQLAREAAAVVRDGTQESKARHWRPVAHEQARTTLALVERVRRLEAVTEYAVHRPGCGRNQSVWRTVDGRPPCTCGLWDLRAALAVVDAPEPEGDGT